MKVSLAILGSVLSESTSNLHTDGILDEKLNFENMKPEEQKFLLEKIFSKMDSDKSETIERSEMLDWAWKIERKYMKLNSDNWVNKRIDLDSKFLENIVQIKYLDRNKNGIIENEEFIEMLEKKKYKHKDGKDLEIRKFDLADKNRDGVLEADEVDVWLVRTICM